MAILSAAEELADSPASNVIPLRWTARGFARAGVVFAISGVTISVSGPTNRKDIYDALVGEVQRRVDVFVRFAPLLPTLPFPRVFLSGVVRVRSGSCDACGDALDPGRAGMCPLCTIALQKTLKRLGRLR